jgi:HPt (histidine-containing phosphotransfer) domain-containing protein
MDEYISKPIDGRELERVIAGILPARAGYRLNAPTARDVPAPAITWNISQTLERLGGDETLLHEVADIFLDECPKQIINLRTAIAEGNAADVEMTAHSLKGELGYLGISEVSQKARELEELGRSRNLQHSAEIFADFETDILCVLNAMKNMNGVNLDSQMDAGQ